eukprot:590889-Pyramimonas_sp.AAC.1
MPWPNPRRRRPNAWIEEGGQAGSMARVDDRGRIASWVLRRNPLFCPELGTTPDSVLHLDTLHTLYLGVFQTFVLKVLTCLVDANIFNVVGPQEVIRAVSLKRLFSDYKGWCNTHNIDKSYQLSTLTTSMVYQQRGNTELKTKAAETGILL